MSYWDPYGIRKLATDKHVGEKADILHAAADILAAEDEARSLRETVTNHMEELDGWRGLPADVRKTLVEGIAGMFEVTAAQKTRAAAEAPAPKGFAAAPQPPPGWPGPSGMD